MTGKSGSRIWQKCRNDEVRPPWMNFINWKSKIPPSSRQLIAARPGNKKDFYPTLLSGSSKLNYRKCTHAPYFIEVKKKEIIQVVFLSQQQLKKIILANARQKGWHVRPVLNNGQWGYVGVKLRRARRTQIGYEFGGRALLEGIESFMSVNPTPIPPIEVSVLTVKDKGLRITDGNNEFLYISKYEYRYVTWKWLHGIRRYLLLVVEVPKLRKHSFFIF